MSGLKPLDLVAIENRYCIEVLIISTLPNRD